MSEQAVFLSGNLMAQVTRMSLTASIGLMALFAVDFVDMIFIAMLGNDALAAAVGYAGTLLFFTNAINIGLSIAAGSLAARSLGQGEPERGREYATNVGIVALVTGVLLPVLILTNRETILGQLGAQGEVLALASRYVSIILPTMGVMGLAMTSMAVLRAHGDARRPMLATLYGGCVNAVLDPLFIFGLGLGLEGAAFASVIARLSMLGFALWPAIRVHQGFTIPSIQSMVRDVATISAIAAPAVLANIATPLGNGIVTRQIAQFGTEAVAGMAVIGRLTPMAFAAILALSGAIGPIIAQNYGALQFDRVKGAYRSGIVFTLLYVLGASLILFLLRDVIAGLFDAEGETLKLIYLYCGPLALLSFFNGVIFVSNASFNNLGRPLLSTTVNWGRHTLGTWPFAIIGAQLAGASGVLMGQALGGVLFAALAWWLSGRVMGGLASPCETPRFQDRWHALLGRRSW